MQMVSNISARFLTVWGQCPALSFRSVGSIPNTYQSQHSVCFGHGDAGGSAKTKALKILQSPAFLVLSAVLSLAGLIPHLNEAPHGNTHSQSAQVTILTPEGKTVGALQVDGSGTWVLEPAQNGETPALAPLNNPAINSRHPKAAHVAAQLTATNVQSTTHAEESRHWQPFLTALAALMTLLHGASHLAPVLLLLSAGARFRKRPVDAEA